MNNVFKVRKFHNLNFLTKGNNLFKFQARNYFKKTNYLQRNRNYNFYEVLGVERGSTNEQIRAAYIKLAKQYHPDVNKDLGSDDKFKSITLAYEALSNERNRDLYDAYMDSDPYSQEWKYKEEHYTDYKEKRERARRDEEAGSYYKHNTESNFWQGRRNQYEEEINKDYENIFSQGYKTAKPQKGEDIKVSKINNI
jgi:curved DNA-binding protein CbpA